MFSETIELRGHFIDSLTLPKVLDQIVTRGATFNIVEFKIGQKRVDPSLARIEITAPSRPKLDELIQRLREQGAEENRSQLREKKLFDLMRELLLCPPDYYGIEYEINPWMSRARGAEAPLAQEQWRGLQATLSKLNCKIELVPPQPTVPDR